MRKINETIYEILKMESPGGMNVSQIITDDLVEKQKAGEVEATDGASDILDQKASELYKETKETTKKREIKASGTRTIKIKTDAGKKKARRKVAKKAGTKKKTGKRAAHKKQDKNNNLALLIAIFGLLIAVAYYLDLL